MRQVNEGEGYYLPRGKCSTYTTRGNSGLYDFLVREYNPAQSRWISPDPVGLSAVSLSSPQTWNRYAYVRNSPLISVDPLGTQDLSAQQDMSNGQYLLNQLDASIQNPDFSSEGIMNYQRQMFLVKTHQNNQMQLGLTDWIGSGSIPWFRRDPDTGQLEVIVGYQTRTALTLNGNTVSGSFPIWGDYNLGSAANDMPTVSQWRPPKPTDTVKAPYKPAPYKPEAWECITAPNDTAEKIMGNVDPNEHDPQAALALAKSGSNQGTVWGNKSYISQETAEQANAATVFFAGAINMLGCMWNVVF